MALFGSYLYKSGRLLRVKPKYFVVETVNIIWSLWF